MLYYLELFEYLTYIFIGNNIMIIRSLLKKMLVSKELESQLNQNQKPVGVYGYDPWGIIPTRL